MAKTILEALRDEIHAPVGDGHLTNRLMARGLDSSATCDEHVFGGSAFQGAIADCLVTLVTMPNISEGDKSISLSADAATIVARANAIYASIGEAMFSLSPKPKVRFR